MTLWIFPANVSPLGVPEAVARAIGEAAFQADQYPDPLCRALTAALSQTEAVPKAWILCGNGAADLIFPAGSGGKRTRCVIAPTFAEYAAALETVDCEIHRHMLREENDFALTDDVLNAIEPPIDRVFLCQPNNPTGQAADRTLMRRILAKCEAVGRAAGSGRVLPRLSAGWRSMDDEAGAGGASRSVYFKGVYKALRHGGRSAGLRSLRRRGFACANAARGSAVGRFVLAQTAGLAALGQTKYVAQVRTLIETERPHLLEGLRALGLRVIEGRANYLLFRADETLGERLEKLGVVVRSCGNYPGLDDSWYRTAVRTRRENDALLAALREAMA